MLLKFFYDQALAHASYLVGCQRSGEAIIVDPGRDVQQYIDTAKREQVKIVGVAETHIHADYVSGARELADRVGAKLYVSDEGPAEWKYLFLDDYAHQLLHDGDRFSVGNVEFLTMHTPGHTPESISFLLTDKGGGADEPMGIFTGDFIFVGSIGRPDLLEVAAGVENTAEPGARDLFQSMKRFRDLPDYLQVWPAHGAGSACGKGLGAIPSSTVGYEKRFNPALQYHDEQEFVDYILAEQPEAPKYFALMKRVNKEGPALMKDLVEPEKLDPKLVADLATENVVVDTSAPRVFMESFVPGTINISTGSMANWGGTLLDYESPLYLITSQRHLAENLRVLRKIGCDRITGYFDSEEVAAAGMRTASITSISPQQLAEGIESGQYHVIDVRGETERQERHVSQSQHIFLGKLMDDPSVFLSGEDKTIAFKCKGGGRSVIATSMALRAGAKNVVNVEGGIDAWEAAGLPVNGKNQLSQV